MARVLFTSISYFPDQPSGAARFAHDLAHGLSRMGHDVWYLCEDSSHSLPPVDVDHGVRVIRYRLNRSPALGPLTHFVHHFKTIGRTLATRLPDAPDVIYGHAPFQYLGALDHYDGQPRSFYTVHSPAIEELTMNWAGQGFRGKLKTMFGLGRLRRLEQDILRRSQGVSVLSEFTLSLLRQHYGAHSIEKVRVMPGWADFDRCKPLRGTVDDARKRLGWSLERPVLFALRRLEPRMGLDNLLLALKSLKDQGYDFSMAIGGAGSIKRSLEQLRDQLGLSDSVSFMGRLTDEEVSLSYAACDASVIPTARLECFGLIALEALACGRPVLVTPVGALPELVGGFEPSWIAKSENPDGIAQLVASFLNGQLAPYESSHIAAKLQKYSLAKLLPEYESWLGIS